VKTLEPAEDDVCYRLTRHKRHLWGRGKASQNGWMLDKSLIAEAALALCLLGAMLLAYSGVIAHGNDLKRMNEAERVALRQRVKEADRQFDSDYPGSKSLFRKVLLGGFPFGAFLVLVFPGPLFNSLGAEIVIGAGYGIQVACIVVMVVIQRKKRSTIRTAQAQSFL
jgi:hypothetical protein